ncbi:MAG: photosystem I reaction center subunit IV, partial [Pseudomonadota bacterium]
MQLDLTRLIFAALMVTAPATHAQDVPDQLDLPALIAPRAAEAGFFDLTETDGRLVAVGERGVILTREPGAQDWIQRPVPLSATLVAVAFNGAGTGLAVGHDGVILRSTDRGETWSKITDGRALFLDVIAIAQGRFEDAQAALEAAKASGSEDAEDLEFAADDESFRLETAQQSLEYGPSWPLLDVVFTGPRTAWAVGAYGTLFLSEDAGGTWTLVSDRTDNFEDLHLNAILQTSAGSLLLAGEAGMMFRSTDGGQSFERFDSFDGLSLFGLLEADGFVAAYGFGDTLQMSRDDGATWESV